MPDVQYNRFQRLFTAFLEGSFASFVGWLASLLSAGLLLFAGTFVLAALRLPDPPFVYLILFMTAIAAGSLLGGYITFRMDQRRAPALLLYGGLALLPLLILLSGTGGYVQWLLMPLPMLFALAPRFRHERLVRLRQRQVLKEEAQLLQDERISGN